MQLICSSARHTVINFSGLKNYPRSDQLAVKLIGSLIRKLAPTWYMCSFTTVEVFEAHIG
jgi:hypothetical protein